ncbi:MAG TPA: hypothetical protein VK517_08125 [Cyclobacteriaceae bacterium]|nr:hypothetical protein [Cyclobacteriaceae bacterium]
MLVFILLEVVLMDDNEGAVVQNVSLFLPIVKGFSRRISTAKAQGRKGGAANQWKFGKSLTPSMLLFFTNDHP